MKPWSRRDPSNSTVDGFLTQAGFKPGSPEFLQARQDVAQHNELRDVNTVHPGQRLWIPQLSQPSGGPEAPPAQPDPSAPPSGTNEALATPPTRPDDATDSAAAAPLEVAVTDNSTPAEALDEQAVSEIIRDEHRWFADPETGKPGSKAANIDAFEVIAADDWSGRQDYIRDLTENSDVSGSEAEARADRFQQAAGLAATNPNLQAVLQGEDPNGSVRIDDAERSSRISDPDSQSAIGTVHLYLEALAESANSSREVPYSHLRNIARAGRDPVSRRRPRGREPSPQPSHQADE